MKLSLLRPSRSKSLQVKDTSLRKRLFKRLEHPATHLGAGLKVLAGAIPLFVLLGTLTGFSQVAQAGSWSFYGYEYSGNARQIQHYFDGDYKVIVRHDTNNSNSDNVKNLLIPGGGLFQAVTSGTFGYAGGNDKKTQEDYANINVTVNTVFEWHRDRLPDGTPNPNDNPDPKAMIYLWEQAKGSCSRSADQTPDGKDYTAEGQSPFDAEGMTLSQVSNGFVDQGPDYNSSPTTISNTFNTEVLTPVSAPGTRIVTVNGQEIEIGSGPPRTLSGRIDFKGRVIPYKKGAGGSIYISYKARMANIRLVGRRQNDTTSAFDNWIVGVAAGGLESPEHKMDVRLEVTDGGEQNFNPEPLRHIPSSVLPKINEQICLYNEKGDEKDAVLVAENQQAETDENGNIIIGVLKSRDLSDEQQVYVVNKIANPPIPYESFPNGVRGIRVFTDWASIGWRMGANGEKEWDGKFWTGTADKTEWIWVKANYPYNSDKPLRGHHMKFRLKRMQVIEKNDAGQDVERIYSTTEKSQKVPGMIEIIGTDDIEEIPASQYVEFAPATATDNNDGIYKTQIKILKNPKATLRSFEIELRDQDVSVVKPNSTP